MSEKEYTITELTEQLGVCKMTAYKLLRSGRIKARKRYGTTHSGDTWLVSQSALDEYKASKEKNICIPKFSWFSSSNRSDIISLAVICSNCNTIICGLSVDVNTNKEETEKSLAKTLFMRACPKCGAKIKE